MHKAPGRRQKEAVSPLPATLPDDPLLTKAVAALAAMPPKQRHARLRRLDQLDAFADEDLAILYLKKSPNTSNAEIAQLFGVHPRTVKRWRRYREIKAWLKGSEESRRRQTCTIDDLG